MENQTFEQCRDRLIEALSQGGGRGTIAQLFNIHPSKARRWIDKVRDCAQPISAEETDEAIVKMGMSRQGLMDKNRVERKKLRENYRIINALEEMTGEFIALLNEKSFTDSTILHEEDQNGPPVAIIQLSDLHLNEIISNVGGNSYNFNIASARLKMLAMRAKQYLIPMGVGHVLLVFSGDLMNSDRRLDEMLNQATNRTKATFLAVDIISQFIRDLNEEFNVSIASVSGNESRVKDELGWVDDAMSDNYDYLICNMLKYLFINAPGVDFIDGDQVECLVSVNGQNILILHGNGSVQSGATERSIAQIKGRYASRGVLVDYVIFGHLHSAQIGDQYARSSSLCGSNAYSEKSLNLAGRASQNVYIIHDNGLRDGIKIDLQVNEGSEYAFDQTLACYNPKSEDKTHVKQSVFSVII